jgi:hypothetical protein
MKPPPSAPDPNHPRLCKVSLPPYRYIPGINKHPVRDPEGHSFGKVHAPLVYSAPEKWRHNMDYLFGVDLFNYAYWWEAHEAWENIWHTTNKDEAHGQFLQGLIQVSAAYIKWYSHEAIGMHKLRDLGLGRLEFVRTLHPTFMGLDLADHLKKLRMHFHDAVDDGGGHGKIYTKAIISFH